MSRSHRHFLASAAITASLAAAGCATYRPVPLDAGAHSASFRARTPDPEPASAWLARLAGQQSGGTEQSPERFDLSDGVSLAEAQAVAMVYSADLRLARLKAGVTLAGATNAGLWQDPTLRVDLTRIIQSAANPWKVFSSVGFTVPLSGRLEIEKRRAGVEHAGELVRVAQREWQTGIELRRAWCRWSAATARADSAAEVLGNVGSLQAVMDAMESAGELSRIEARLFRMERLARVAELEQARAEAAEGELTIKGLMGMAPGSPLRFEPTLVAAGAENGWNDVTRPVENRPMVEMARVEYEVAERTLELEVRRQYPDLTIGPGYGSEDGQDQFLLGLAAPLPVLNANRRAIAEATAARELARAGVEAAVERTEGELALARLALESSSRRRAALERELLPMVDAQLEDVRGVARLGEVNTPVLIESLRRRHDALLALVGTRRDETLAHIRIDELLGPRRPAGTDPATLNQGDGR